MTADSNRSLKRAIQKLYEILGPFAGLLAVIALFSYLTRDTDAYLSADNLKTIVIQTAIIATCGIGMTLIIIGGGIDLSVGSAIALTAVIVALVFNGDLFATIVETVFLDRAWLAWTCASGLSAAAIGWRFWRGSPFMGVGAVGAIWLIGYFVFHQQGGVAAVCAGALAGAALGWFNGALITATRVVPFIITLGMMEVFRGAAQLLAQGKSIDVDYEIASDYEWVFSLMSTDPQPSWLLIGPGAWVMLLAGMAAGVVLWRMRLGRYIFAIGSNEQAARLSGIRVPQVKLWIYSLAGLATGLAGVMTFSRLNYGSSTAGAGLELDVIAAVVIGGGSLRGGEGSILGTFVGAFIMGFMRNGCDIAGIPNSVQRILIGAVIVLAVAIDEFRHRRSA